MLLSICIPTYNQPDSLANLLDKIIAAKCSNIEVIICDDSSNDLSLKVVESRAPLFPFKYFKRDRLGLDDALIFLTEKSSGDYVWWFGDDSLISEKISEILSLLSADPEISFLWINSAECDNPSRLTKSNLDSYYFKDMNQILMDLDLGLLGFITATIFKRDLGFQSLMGAKKFKGSAFVCLYIILYVITRGNRYYYLGNVCFTSKPKPPGELRWYDQTEVFGVNLMRVASSFKKYFDENVFDFAINANLRMVLRAIIVERSLGYKTGFASNNSKIIPLMAVYWDRLLFWRYLPLLCLNQRVLVILYRRYKGWFA